MSYSFLDGLRITTSQWMILDSITRALRENFELTLTQFPCITFKKVDAREEPVCKDEQHGYQYQIVLYVGMGYFFCKEVAGKIPLIVSFEQVYGEHLPDNSDRAYIHENFFIALKIDGEEKIKRFSISGFAHMFAEQEFEEQEVPFELHQFS